VLILKQAWGRFKTRNPQTFGEKLRYKIARDRRKFLTTTSDKASVRDYVESKVGKEVLTETYGIVSDAEDLSKLDLPRNYVVKASHGSGGVVLVWEGADPETPAPSTEPGWETAVLHPDAVTVEDLIPACKQWLSQTYGDSLHEWFYQDIVPRIVVEEVLFDQRGDLPVDYKFFVFHGRCQWVQVFTSRFIDEGQGAFLHVPAKRSDIFLPDWKHLPVDFCYPRADTPPEAPPNLDRMLQLAGRLGEDTDFVRVDLYDLGDRIVFGELTSTPKAGGIVTQPSEFDSYLGQWWNPPPRYDD